MRDTILFLAVLALCSVLSDAQQAAPTDKAALAREWPSAPQIETGPTLLRRPACSLRYTASDYATDTVPCGWTRRNRHLLVGFLALQAADYAATERGYQSGHWHERNPLMPGTSAGRAGYFAATAAGVLAAS